MTTTLETYTEAQVTDAFTKGFTRRSERDKQVKPKRQRFKPLPPQTAEERLPFQYLTADNALWLQNRFWDKVVKTEDCWEWVGAKVSKGYGSIATQDGQTATAHRLAFEFEYGTRVPDAMTIDHLCFNRGCVNVAHFEVVTSIENTQRRWDRYRREVQPFITHCIHGHGLTPENTYGTPKGHRVCKICVRNAGRKHDAKRGWRR